MSIAFGRRFLVWQPVVACLCLAVPSARAEYQGVPGPLTDAHLKIIRPGSFQAATGSPAPTIQSDEAVFGRAVPLTTDASKAAFDVNYGGEYGVWVRVGRRAGGPAGVKVELSAAGQALLSGRINEDDGAAGRGGPGGHRDYIARAHLNTPRNTAVNDIALWMDQQGGPEKQPQGRGRAADAEDMAVDTADEVFAEMQRGTADQWVSLHRVEKPGAGNYFWWKLGQATLVPGEHELRLSLLQPATNGKAPVVDAAILTGATNLVYPYAADITAPRASYVRFRLDRVPADGLTLSIRVHTHIYPRFWTKPAFCNPDGMSPTKAIPHAQPGYTRWYCLQDLEYAPGPDFGGHTGLSLSLGRKEKDAEGATQFAMWPYADEVVREISWQQPSGRGVSMLLDFEKHPDQLRTFRDHAREHYEQALKATGGRLFPLTWSDLHLRTSAGGNESSIDYTAKALLLLGINNGRVGAYARAFGMNAFGGGTLQGGAFFPADPDESRRYYAERYVAFQNLATNVPVVQMCDEPSEAWGTALSSPLWLYEEPPGKEPRWMDYAGNSELHTRFLGYANCVLEGSFERWRNFEWRLGCNRASSPTAGVFWRIGKVLPDTAPENLAWGDIRSGEGAFRGARVNAACGATAGKFRLVWEGTRAALYVNDTLAVQMDDVPAHGGFGFAGDRKAVAGLRVRALRKDERLGAEKVMDGADDGNVADLAVADLAEDPELELDDKPAWMRPKPLKQFVEEDWRAGGGMPEARLAYQRWLKTQGVEPARFGKKSFDELGPMCIQELATTPDMRRAYYWSRRFCGYLTPLMFSCAMDGMRANAPRKDLRAYVGLSGDAMDVYQWMAMDMFQLAQYTNGLMPGVSDWSTARTGSEQVNAFNAAFFNAGARRFGASPASKLMMHCVHPTTFRAYTCLANNVKYLSYYTFGPIFVQPYKDWWSDRYRSYPACSLVNNRVTQIDDLVAPGLLRPSRVALFYAMSARYWGDPLVPDKRMAFMALAGEYYQPELVNEDHVAEGALDHYDALYVLDPYATAVAQAKIQAWVENGGLLWTCADAGTLNEYNEPQDLLGAVAGAKRLFAANTPPADAAAKTPPLTVTPVNGEADFVAHTVVTGRMAQKVEWPGARVRAVYDDGRPAWMEKVVGKGRVVYIGHRAGETYASKILRRPSSYWSDIGRSPLTTPLHEARIAREYWLSEPCFMAGALSTTAGTVVVLYNMQPAARENVVLSLKEPRQPHRVEIFDGYRLVPLEHEYAGGVVSAKLPPFADGQMVVVRNAAAPADYAHKQAEMKAQATELLASTNETDLSVGAFLAAANPEWGLAGKVAALVGHENWIVRRQAAETLGWLGHRPGGEALAAAAAKEQDAHALGEQILALARLKHPKARELARAHLRDTSAHVKRMSALAATELLFGSDAATHGAALDRADLEFGLLVAAAARAEPDVRVRREGIRLTGRLDPKLTVATATAAFGDGKARDEKGQRFWIEAVAQNPAALEEYLKQSCPGGDALFYGVAAAAPHPGLAQALDARLEAMTSTNTNGQAMGRAMATQKDPTLARKALARRAQLPPGLVDYLPYVLDRLFNARLGADLDEWARWMADKR